MATSTPARGASTPLSPTRISRLQEKEQLQHLNDRLAVYIDRVRSLELENDRLMLQVSEKEEVTTREVSGIKLLYESELADARKVLDETARDKARLQIELGKYRSDLDEVTKTLKKKVADLAEVKQRNKELEALHLRSEGALSTALNDKRDLEADLGNLRSQLTKAEDAHSVAKRQLESETLMRVDLENRCQSLQEDLEFRKNAYEEEFRETRKRHNRSVVEIDKGQKFEYESKLAQALDELRKQHDEQVRLYKEEMEQTYQSKLDNIRRSSDQNDQSAKTVREELNEARMRVEALSYQLTSLQKQLNASEDRVRVLEEMLSNDRDKYRELLDNKERELAGMRDLIQRQLSEYQELLDVKYALDMEIIAYRKLLEGEEERLKLSPSQPRVKVSRATSSSSSATTYQSRNKRKRMEAGEREEASIIKSSASSATGLHASCSAGERSRFRMSEQSTATGSITIEEIDQEGKFIHLNNNSDEDRPLGSWRLKLNIGDLEEMVYKFTPKYVLKAGQSVKIYSCDAGVAHSPPSVLIWKSQSSWGVDGNIQISLVNSDEEEVAVRTVTKTSVSIVDEEDGEDDEADYGEEDLFHQQGDPRTTSTGCYLM